MQEDTGLQVALIWAFKSIVTRHLQAMGLFEIQYFWSKFNARQHKGEISWVDTQARTC